MPDSSARHDARNDLATALTARGSAYANAAASVRAGYENIWISAALDALERRQPMGDDDE